jgi:hypothetical protein
MLAFPSASLLARLDSRSCGRWDRTSFKLRSLLVALVKPPVGNSNISDIMPFSQRQRFALRLTALAAVNAGVYALYVSAIASARAGVRESGTGYVERDGSTAWQSANAYKRYLRGGLGRSQFAERDKSARDFRDE